MYLTPKEGLDAKLILKEERELIPI